jgi:membrane protease YdiL (CAAX protease family)
VTCRTYRRLRRTLFLAFAVALLLFAPRAHLPIRVSLLFGLTIGVVAGWAVFALLARRLRPPPLGLRPVARVVGFIAPRLIGGVVVEELFWRYLLLSTLAVPLGTPAAIAISSVAFAAAHASSVNSHARVHVLTGTTFACAYAGTGRLGAAIAAHLTYNVLVIAASVGWANDPAYG